MLVTKANNEVELLDSLKDVSGRLNEIYELRRGRGDKKIIVEEFIDGDLYSVDAYIDHRGCVVFSPMVKTITGIKAGKQDYYGYFQMTPSGLHNTQVSDEDKEGTVASISGLDEIKNIVEVKLVVQNIFVGEKFIFARNGGVSLFEIIISAESEERLTSVLASIEMLLDVKIDK